MTSRQAIQTKYIGPGSRRGSRVKAWCLARTRFYAWEDALSSHLNHEVAARRLMRELDWHEHNEIVCGGLKDGSYVFVLVEKLASGLIRRWE